MTQPTEKRAMPRSPFRAELISQMDVDFTRLVTDSRAVVPGDTFVAYPGNRVDGRHYIAQAIANGANAVIWEARGFRWNAEWRVPNLAVAELLHHAGEIAAHIYDHPSQDLWVVGITGTNGKTSCSHWIAQALQQLGQKTALIGTLGNGFPGALQHTLNTTPDAIRLQGLLAEYRKEGAQAIAMEVSSHALEQGRVLGVKYDVALLTNLSRDHLDFHGDMQNYAAAKRRLFNWQELKFAVINLDDPFGADLAQQIRDGAAEVVAYGMSVAALELAERFGLRMVYGNILRMDAQGLSLRLQTSWGSADLDSKLIGRFNAANLLAVLAVLLVSDVKLVDAVRELARVQAVPGRMQAFGGEGRPAVLVDFAHTPDALEKVLQSAREVAQARGGKLICVFGCGGDRDRGKRPLMGAIAARLADRCIITSDNPRSEAPQDIIAEIAAGITEHNYQINVDRAAAITQAIHGAQAEDTVLIAGKGHEDYQEIMSVKYPYSDIDMVQQIIGTWQARETA
ncbi:MAG: UDP-N-acetylmuramoyl-L-alanyl-D-glutamate--2,6-diaminopimelate ligase [Pseudomonadota bacterium]